MQVIIEKKLADDIIDMCHCLIRDDVLFERNKTKVLNVLKALGVKDDENF